MTADVIRYLPSTKISHSNDDMSNQVPGPSDDGVTPSAGLSRVGTANAVTELPPSPSSNVDREKKKANVMKNQMKKSNGNNKE